MRSRLAVIAALCLAAAAALAASGHPTPALILAVLTVVNNVLLVVLPEGTHVAEAVR